MRRCPLIDRTDSFLPCGEMVSGGLASYPCVLPRNHVGVVEGYHVANEIPGSRVRYDQWMGSMPSVSDVSSSPAQDESMFILNPSFLADPDERDAKARFSAQERSYSPAMVVVLNQALTSLAILWRMCQSEFARGAQGVVVTPEFLSRLTPLSLREFVEQVPLAQDASKEHGPT